MPFGFVPVKTSKFEDTLLVFSTRPAAHPTLNMFPKLLLIISFTMIGWSSCSSDNVLWGVPPSEVHLYKPGVKFTCKDQKLKIPYEKVNDNYCDCRDGSDEPSTSACAHGVFYCLNKGYLGHMVPSNRVNDGICDCCDGSDEYASQTCANTCAELELEKKKKEAELEDLHEDDINDEDEETVYRASMVHMGTRKQQEKLERLRKLELDKALAEEALKDLEKLTRSAEKKANEALSQMKNGGKEYQDEEKSLEDGYAHDAFVALDLNQDGILDIEEIKKEEIFDLNKDMMIEDREVKWYYDAMPGIANEDLFRTKMWKKMGRLYVLEKKLDEAVKFEFHADTLDDVQNSQEREEKRREKKSANTPKYEYTPEDSIDLDAEEDYEDLEESMENLDENTKRMVKQAMEARKRLNDAKEKLKDVKQQKVQVEETLFEADPDDEDRVEGIVEHLENFGPKERSKYFPLRMHCYKYNTKEFLYRMCPFFGCTQTPKNKPDKDSIDLGRWVGWGKEDGEPIMVFKHGEYCEKDGSRRSARVRIYCGARNLLVHVEETNTCRYRMEFKSPAGCHIRNLREANFTYTSHDEL